MPRRIIECRLRSWFYWQIVISHDHHMSAIAWKYGDNYYSVKVSDEYKVFEGHIHKTRGVAVVFGKKKIYIIYKDKLYYATYPSTVVDTSHVFTTYKKGVLIVYFGYDGRDAAYATSYPYVSRFIVGHIMSVYYLDNPTFSKITYDTGLFEVFIDAKAIEYKVSGYEMDGYHTVKYNSDGVDNNDAFWTSRVVSSVQW